MRVWFPTGQRPLVKVHPGRENTHVYGALNLHSGEEVLLRSELMNAQVSALFLSKVLQAYPDKPLLLLWDRAPFEWPPFEGIAGQRYERYGKPTRLLRCCGCLPLDRS